MIKKFLKLVFKILDIEIFKLKVFGVIVYIFFIVKNIVFIIVRNIYIVRCLYSKILNF